MVPGTQPLNGQDATAYILSANINRRHMSKGQRAVAVAKLIPAQQGKKTSSEMKEVSATHISRARTVLTHAPELSDSVLTGSLSLDKAYEQAKLRKEAANNHEAQILTKPLFRDDVCVAWAAVAGGSTESFRPPLPPGGLMA